MKSVFKSNISWFILLSIFFILLPYAMEENKHETKIYSLKQLQNDFIGLWKNPQKYVEFQLNAQQTSRPDAGGLYELLPYYQKINPLGEKTNYAIQYCAFDNKWELVEANQIGLFPSLDNELSTIATLLEGDQFSRPTKTDIKAYTTYEQMKSVVNTVGVKNKELQMKINEMENEIALVHAQNEKLKTFVQEKNEKFKKFKIYTESQTEQYKKTLEEYQQNFEKMELQNSHLKEKDQQNLEKIELLKSNLKEKEIQMNNKNESVCALRKEIGCLSYQLSMIEDREQKYKSIEKDVERQKIEKKQKDENLKACEERVHELEILLRPLMQKRNDKINDFEINIEMQKLQIQNANNSINSSKTFINKQNEDIKEQKKINKVLKNEKKDLEEEINDLHNEMDALMKASEATIESYSTEEIRLNTKIENQQNLLNKQWRVIDLQENDSKLKEFGVKALMNNFYKYNTFHMTTHTQEKGQNTENQ